MAVRKRAVRMVKKDENVIGGRKREVFHSEDCVYASYLRGSNRIEFENAREAREAGFIPCRICLGWDV